MDRRKMILALTILGVFVFAVVAGAQQGGLSPLGNVASAKAASGEFQLTNDVEGVTPQTDADRLEATKDYVNKAIAAYREDPEAALAYYRSEESVVDDPPGLYLLLLDGDTIKVNPVFSAAEGTRISWRDDPLGNMYGARLAAADEDGVVVEYLLPISSQDYTYRKKTAWAIRADVPDIDNPGSETSLVFSAGWLDLETDVESTFTEAQRAVGEVIEARGRIQAETWQRTRNHYKNPDTIDGEFYVWLAFPSGPIAADATMPELEGTNIADAYPEVGEEMLALEGFETRWFSHMWPNPVTGQVELKHSYVTRFFDFFIVSGYYDEAPPVVGPRAAAQAYVRTAIAAYREDPDAAKEYYGSEASVDRENDLYLFIIDGTEIILSGGFAGSVGDDITGRIGTDAIGKEYGKELAAADENGVFVDYLIPDPLDNYTLFRKHTWAIKADGLIFAAGSWDKTVDVEATLEPHEHVVGAIYKAGARLLRLGAQRTLGYYNTPASIDGERYVFIIDGDGITGLPAGTILADATGAFPRGANINEQRATDVQDLGMQIAAVPEGDFSWISHLWPNPANDGEIEQKHTYVTKFRGLIFGSGYYGDMPPPAPADPCLVEIGGGGTFTGSWNDECLSESRPQDAAEGGTAGEDYYARFYTFTLDAESDVTITLTSDEDTFLYLLDGHGTSGSENAKNDDIANDDRNSRIEATGLAAGDYTIEATTYDAETSGNFTLSVEIGDVTTVPPPSEVKYKAISSGLKHACAITTAGSIDCRGDDSSGQVSERPTSGNFTDISSGEDHTCALRDDGAWICWGSVTVP